MSTNRLHTLALSFVCTRLGLIFCSLTCLQSNHINTAQRKKTGNSTCDFRDRSSFPFAFTSSSMDSTALGQPQYTRTDPFQWPARTTQGTAVVGTADTSIEGGDVLKLVACEDVSARILVSDALPRMRLHSVLLPLFCGPITHKKVLPCARFSASRWHLHA